MTSKKQILFVCLGNICRSPSAEAVFTTLVKRGGYSDRFTIDSAGVQGYHAGEPADSRMKAHAVRRDFELTSISRPVSSPEDFEKFDLIIGMDAQNIRDLNGMAPNEDAKRKIHIMTDFCETYDYDSVPDPYYGGSEGFELVLDILEDACSGLLKNLTK